MLDFHLNFLLKVVMTALRLTCAIIAAELNKIYKTHALRRLPKSEDWRLMEKKWEQFSNFSMALLGIDLSRC